MLWTVDFKGWWYTKENEKCEPITIRDDYSKFIFDIRILEKGDISSVKRVFEKLFKKYGIPECFRSDNGPPFAHATALQGLTKLSAWWIALGIKIDRIDPGSPYQNGSNERFLGTWSCTRRYLMYGERSSMKRDLMKLWI